MRERIKPKLDKARNFSSEKARNAFLHPLSKKIAAGVLTASAIGGSVAAHSASHEEAHNPGIAAKSQISQQEVQQDRAIATIISHQVEHQKLEAKHEKEQAEKKGKAEQRQHTISRHKQQAQSHEKPTPVAGMSRVQMDNATVIVKTVEKQHMPEKAKTVALATALQESKLLNYANRNIPKSMRLPHQAVGEDHASVGLFQQQVGYDGSNAFGWGNVNQTMNPEKSTDAFLNGLKKVKDWENMPVTVAAQKVQASAYPSAYADDEHTAKKIVATIEKSGQ